MPIEHRELVLRYQEIVLEGERDESDESSPAPDEPDAAGGSDASRGGERE